MKLLHLSDLHLGRRMDNIPLIEDQKYILDRILAIVKDEQPDCIIIAGDVYDRPVPPVDAVELFDDFLVRLADLKQQVFIIAGNHDSAERLSFGGRLIDGSGIHFAPVYDGVCKPHVLQDEFGPVEIYLLPFLKPAHVRRFFEDEEIATYTDAMRVAVENMLRDSANEDSGARGGEAAGDKKVRRILVTHQFVTGAALSDSEEITVGGTDNVDASVFDAFDYVALGHIHRPQDIGGGGRIRYCGTPLKYSFSEASHEKSVTVAELGAPAASAGKTGDGSGKCELSVRTVGLAPLREMRELKGSYEEVTAKKFYDGTSYREDFVHITLTDEEDVPDAFAKLQVIYRNLMKLSYDNRRTRHKAESFDSGALPQRTPEEHFGDFFLRQNGMELSQEQADFVKDLIEKVWGDAE